MGVSTAYPNSRNARGVAIATNFKNLREGNIAFLPQRVALVGQGSTSAVYSTDKRQVTSAAEVGSTYGFGSPLHLASKQLLPSNGDGLGSVPLTIYPLDDAATGVAATGDITPGGVQLATASYNVIAGGIKSEPFVLTKDDTVAVQTAAINTAINANIDMPIIAVDNTTKVDFTSKHEGTSGNEIALEIVSSDDSANTFAFTAMNGGLVNPDVDDALNQIGTTWETIVVNCLEIGDEDSLDKYQTFGEGRWGAEERKPLVVLTGNTIADPIAASAIAVTRTDDRVNGQCVLPGSNDLPWSVVARHVAKIAVRADSDPAYDYASQKLYGLTPGADTDQWTSSQREAAFDRGSSSVIIRDGVANIGDTITFWHPEGEEPPAYQFVVDIFKVATILYNLDLIFDTPEWDGKPLVPDFETVTNPNAKKPKMAVADISAMIDSLADNAIISDRQYAKDNTVAEIDENNPKRLNVRTRCKISGNTNVISVDLEWGFYFGSVGTIG